MTHLYAGAIAFSLDSKYVVSSGWDNPASSLSSVRVWKASTGQEVARMIHDSSVSSIAFSPDGKYVVSGSLDHTARVWEATTGVEVARMTHDSIVSSVAFSPVGKYVVSGSLDHTARVWQATTGVEGARMTHESRVTSVAFSPDSKYVVSGSGWDIMDSRGYGSTARVWDASTGVEAARMAHDAPVNSVAFSPDGKYVVSAGCDKVDFDTDNFGACTEGTARVWPWQPDDMIAHVCAGSFWRMRNLTRVEWKQYIGDALPYQAVCPNEPIEPDVTPTPRAAELESWTLTAYSLTATQLGWTQTPVFSPVEITPGVTYMPAVSP